jgi:hypothetical protein
LVTAATSFPSNKSQVGNKSSFPTPYFSTAIKKLETTKKRQSLKKTAHHIRETHVVQDALKE